MNVVDEIASNESSTTSNKEIFLFEVIFSWRELTKSSSPVKASPLILHQKCMGCDKRPDIPFRLKTSFPLDPRRPSNGFIMRV